jgi:hypothetical protein
MDTTQIEDATNGGPYTDENRNVPRDASADALAIQEPIDESLEAIEVIYKDPAQTEDATNLGPATEEHQNVHCDVSANALANQEPDDKSMWMFLEITDVFIIDPTTTDDATNHSRETDESRYAPSDASANAPAVQEPNKSLKGTDVFLMDPRKTHEATDLSHEKDKKRCIPCDASGDAPAIQEPDDEHLEVTDDFAVNPTQAEDATNLRHEMVENRYIHCDASADTPTFLEPNNESLGVNDVFAMDPTQTKDAANHSPEIDKHRNPRDASLFALAFQETDDESLKVIDVFFINQTQTEDADSHQLETVEDDLEFLSLAKAEMAEVEDVSSLAEAHPKSDAPILKAKRDPNSVKFKAIDKLRRAMKSPRLKQSYGENRNIQCDASADAPAIRAQKPDGISLAAVEAIFMDQTQTEDATSRGLETDEKRNFPCDKSADAPAIQEPNDEILNIDDVFVLNRTQTEDAADHQLVSAEAENAAVEELSTVAKPHPKSEAFVVKAKWDPFPVKFNKLRRAVKSPKLKQFLIKDGGKKKSLLSRKVFVMDESLDAIEAIFMDPTRTEDSPNQQLEPVECDLDSILSTSAGLVGLEEVSSLRNDNPKTEDPVVAKWDLSPLKFETLDKLRPAVKSPIDDFCHFNDGGQNQPLLDSPDGSRHVFDSMDQTQTENATNHRHVVKPPKFEGLRHAYGHSSTSHESKLREDNISTKTSKSQLSFSDKSVISQKQVNKKRSTAECKHVKETDSPCGQVVEERSVESKEGEGLHQSVTLGLSEEVLTLRGMISQLQGKINEIDRIDKSSRPQVKINDIKNTACCYFNDSPEWFARSGDLDSLSKTSSNCTESINGDLSSTQKSCIESIDGVISSFSESTNGHLYLV